MGRGLCSLKLLPIPNEGACRLSCQIAQLWCTKGRGRHEVSKNYSTSVNIFSNIAESCPFTLYFQYKFYIGNCPHVTFLT